MPDSLVTIKNLPPAKEAGLALPTRIICYAWGEKYIGELMSMTLPALLAPGNLPVVAAAVPCEVVILTQEVFFARFLADPVIIRIQQFCPVRLIELDDLIPTPDKYGIALTHVLHRGFADLGAAVTDTWLILLNADFVLADGSLRNLLKCLMAGHRLIASPSYCVNKNAVIPELLKRVDPVTRALSFPHRELAALIINNRHNTIRGKTVNQTFFSIRYMDQFYWLVNNTTLIGHQMPVAIVAMRPERYVAEPNSYWDHGLMKEFFPTTEHFVMGDSDDFLMLELRGEEVAQELLRLGWPQPAEIALDYTSFLTPYQKDMVRYPLVLHSDDLPADMSVDRTKLGAFIDSVMAHVPAVLPSHIGHPQWDYHRPGFIEARHKHLSAKLGSATEDAEPPAQWSELDKAWWRLDGLEKAYARKRTEIEATVERERAIIAPQSERLELDLQARQQEIEARLASGLKGMLDQPESTAAHPTIARADLGSGSCKSATADGQPAGEGAWVSPLAQFEQESETLNHLARAQRETLAKAQEHVERQYKNRLVVLDLEYQTARLQAQSEYERLLNRRITSAAIPHVASTRGPLKEMAPASRNIAAGLIMRLYSGWFGRLPRVQPMHPYWAAMRHLIRIVDRAAASGAKDVLVVVAGGGVADTIADDLPGLHARASLADVLQGNFVKAFDQIPLFDLCICSIEIGELHQFSEMVKAVSPTVRKGGKIVGFHANFDLREFSPHDMNLLRGLFNFPGSAQIYYAGSEPSASVVRKFRTTVSKRGAGLFGAFARISTMLLVVAPRALRANRSEDALPSEHSAQMHPECTSITIEVTV